MNNQPNNSSLVKCPACQQGVSRQTVSCPKCGQPLHAMNYQQPQFQQNFPQPVPKKGGIGKTFGVGCLGLIGFFVVIGILTAAFLPKTNNSTQNQPAQNTQAKENPISAQPTTKKQSPAAGLKLADSNGVRRYAVGCAGKIEDLDYIMEMPLREKVFESCLQ